MPILEEYLGETIELRARAVDFHSRETLSEPLRISVKGDQVPTVALSHPVEGSSWVAGLPIEMRADASDDVAVQSVEFYVNDRLIGTDLRAPFTGIYDSPVLTGTEQVITMHAVVKDSQGQSNESRPIQITLGKDEDRPVLNVVSPEVTRLEGDNNLSEVVENSEMIFKIAGFDNVGRDQAGIDRPAPGRQPLCIDRQSGRFAYW